MNAPSGHVVAAAPRFFAERIALLFCAPMLVAGIALPYFPVWLNTLSLSDVEIGIVLAVPMIMRVVTAPIAGVIADRIGERTVVLVWSAILSFATALALFAADSLWPVLLVFSLQGAVFAPFMPIAEAMSPTICGGTTASGKKLSQMAHTARPASAESRAPCVLARAQ